MTGQRTRLVAAGLGTTLAVAALAGCNSSDSETAKDAPARPAPVALSHQGAPKEITVGVVVSLTSPPGEGSDWSRAAEGAQVAAYRFGLGDISVTVQPADDKGTARGARQAVQKLVSGGVSGIVLATEGDHVRGAVAAAADAGVPVLLPYETDTAGLPDTAWATGPDHQQVDATLASALKTQGAHSPVVVDAGDGVPDGIDPVGTYRLRAGGDADRLAATIARAGRSSRPGSAPAPDSVLVSGPARLQATVVRALQGADVDLPVLLTPDALSPDFADTLAGLDGALAGRFTTVGTNAGDVAAMDPGDDGQALSAYFAALRSTTQDNTVKDFFDNQPFAEVSDDADTRSHDAVVALVTAAAEAGSTDPADVAKALSTLRLTHADGLAGPSLDFTSRHPLADDAVVALQASTEGPGVRPATTGAPSPQLYWFAAPQQ